MTPHPNAWTCGTGKWSIRLAAALGVPCVHVMDRAFAPAGLVLVSARMSEISATATPPPVFDLIVHDWTTWDDFTWPRHWDQWLERAEHIYAANIVLQQQIRAYRPDVRLIPVPSAVAGNWSRRAGYRVLTFGMAHKRLASHFEALKVMLERDHPDYQIRLSTAVHEGSPWDRSLEQAEVTLRPLFGDRLRFLGYLADDALVEELHACDAAALYYTPALRANNTSYWVAKEAGIKIYTNRDDYSPPESAVAPSWESVTRILCGA